MRPARACYTDRMAVTHEVSDAGHRGRAEQPHNAPGPGRGQQRLVGVRVVTPGAGVEILFGIRISVTLEKLDVIILKHWPIITLVNPQSLLFTDLALIYCDPVEAHSGKHHGAPSLGQVGVDADSEQRLAVILAPVARTPELGSGSWPTSASLPLGARLCTRLPENRLHFKSLVHHRPCA